MLDNCNCFWFQMGQSKILIEFSWINHQSHKVDGVCIYQLSLGWLAGLDSRGFECYFLSGDSGTLDARQGSIYLGTDADCSRRNEVSSIGYCQAKLSGAQANRLKCDKCLSAASSRADRPGSSCQDVLCCRLMSGVSLHIRTRTQSYAYGANSSPWLSIIR